MNPHEARTHILLMALCRKIVRNNGVPIAIYAEAKAILDAVAKKEQPGRAQEQTK